MARALTAGSLTLEASLRCEDGIWATDSEHTAAHAAPVVPGEALRVHLRIASSDPALILPPELLVTAMIVRRRGASLALAIKPGLAWPMWLQSGGMPPSARWSAVANAVWSSITLSRPRMATAADGDRGDYEVLSELTLPLRAVPAEHRMSGHAGADSDGSAARFVAVMPIKLPLNDANRPVLLLLRTVITSSSPLNGVHGPAEPPAGPGGAAAAPTPAAAAAAIYERAEPKLLSVLLDRAGSYSDLFKATQLAVMAPSAVRSAALLARRDEDGRGPGTESAATAKGGGADSGRPRSHSIAGDARSSLLGSAVGRTLSTSVAALTARAGDAGSAVGNPHASKRACATAIPLIATRPLRLRAEQRRLSCGTTLLLVTVRNVHPSASLCVHECTVEGMGHAGRALEADGGGGGGSGGEGTDAEEAGSWVPEGSRGRVLLRARSSAQDSDGADWAWDRSRHADGAAESAAGPVGSRASRVPRLQLGTPLPWVLGPREAHSWCAVLPDEWLAPRVPAMHGAEAAAGSVGGISAAPHAPGQRGCARAGQTMPPALSFTVSDWVFGNVDLGARSDTAHGSASSRAVRRGAEHGGHGGAGACERHSTPASALGAEDSRWLRICPLRVGLDWGMLPLARAPGWRPRSSIAAVPRLREAMLATAIRARLSVHVPLPRLPAAMLAVPFPLRTSDGVAGVAERAGVASARSPPSPPLPDRTSAVAARPSGPVPRVRFALLPPQGPVQAPGVFNVSLRVDNQGDRAVTVRLCYCGSAWAQDGPRVSVHRDTTPMCLEPRMSLGTIPASSSKSALVSFLAREPGAWKLDGFVLELGDGGGGSDSGDRGASPDAAAAWRLRPELFPEVVIE